jgi:hypothetical protein
LEEQKEMNVQPDATQADMPHIYPEAFEDKEIEAKV